MPKPFKEFAVEAIAHAKQVIEWMDSGEWEENADLRHHYRGIIEYIEHELARMMDRNA